MERDLGGRVLAGGRLIPDLIKIRDQIQAASRRDRQLATPDRERKGPDRAA